MDIIPILGLALGGITAITGAAVSIWIQLAKALQSITGIKESVVEMKADLDKMSQRGEDLAVLKFQVNDVRHRVSNLEKVS